MQFESREERERQMQRDLIELMLRSKNAKNNLQLGKEVVFVEEEKESGGVATNAWFKAGMPRQCIKQLLRMACSHLGIMVMVIAYIIIGAFLFRYLEQTNEINICHESSKKFKNRLNDTLERLWSVHDSKANESVTKEEFRKLLTSFTKTGYILAYDPELNCSTLGESGNNFKWSESNAILFAVTIISTIGYGHITPKTFWGRLVCMGYAVLGIPLMLLWLSNISDVMANVFKIFYIRICCCGCYDRFQHGQHHQKQSNLPGNKIVTHWENVHPSDNILMIDEPPDKVSIVIDEDIEDVDYDKVTIPLTITISVLGFYIFLGSVLFGHWENWEQIEGAYFSFITLSTIGFGDFVPGKNGFEKSEVQTNMIFGAIYMLFGMSILSMCFHLIQDAVAAKFTWLAQKVGLIEDEFGEQDEMEAEEKIETNGTVDATSA